MDAMLAAIAAVSARERARVGRSDGGAVPDKPRAIADTVAVLSGLAVPHALIGGVAVGIRSGVARATEDTDLAIATSADRDEVVAAMVAAGFVFKGAHPHSLNFRHTSGEPVQLALDAGFDAFIARATPVELDEGTVPVVLVEDLVAMKERSAADPGRRRSKALRDLADAALLRGDAPDPDEGW